MEPQEYFVILRKRWILIVILILICGATAFGYSTTLPKLFKATSSVFVASQQGETTSELVQGSTFTQAQVQSLAQLATLPVVLEPAIQELNLDTAASDLAPTVSSDIRLNTVIIDVTVSNASPEEAADIANAVTTSLAEVAEGLYSESAITMKRVASADVPTSTYSPNTRLIVITGLLAGLLIGVAYALGREVLDTRIRGPRDLERVTDVSILGAVARWNKKKKTTIVMRSDAYSPEAEDIRRVATNIEFTDVDHPIRAAIVTSGSPEEGKSTVAINLALALAERYSRVLLVDADLRKPSIADYCGIDGSVGLTSVLVGSATLAEATRPWAENAIDVLPSGAIPHNPTQMLGSKAMEALLNDLRSNYDFVLLDSPPILPVTDPLILANLVDGFIVVTRFKSTRRQQLREAVDSLDAVKGRILGVVLNGTNPQKEEPYYSFRRDQEALEPVSPATEPASIANSPEKETDLIEMDTSSDDHRASDDDVSEDNSSGQAIDTILAAPVRSYTKRKSYQSKPKSGKVS